MAQPPDPDDQNWPAPGAALASDAAAAAEYAAKLDVRSKRVDADVARAQAYTDADLSSLASFHQHAMSLAAASVDRAQSAALSVQRAAAAIALLYTGVVGLAFSVTSRPLPSRGSLSPVFLGLAVVLATAYVAYLGPNRATVSPPRPGPGLEAQALERLSVFIELTQAVVAARSRLLRSSVAALGLGLALLPAPFVGSNAVTAAAGPAWPEPPAATTTTAARASDLLYAAQVNEASRLRQAASIARTSDDLVFTGVALAIGSLAVALLPLLIGPRGPKHPS